MRVTCIILSRDEAIHIERAIRSITPYVSRVVVVDSGSVDDTLRLAESAGAKVLSNPWKNYSTQFNWAISQVDDDTDWIFRLDADEYISPELGDSLQRELRRVDDCVGGFICDRYMTFLGDPVKRGGVFPVQVLRCVRSNSGRCESRWMDEHLIVTGSLVKLSGRLVDDNKKSLSWWIEKHNRYACREVVDILQSKGCLTLDYENPSELGGGQVSRKRRLKERYNKSPLFIRALIYFATRYILHGGMFDTRGGRLFHVMQGFWYRFIVDAKCLELERYKRRTKCSYEAAVLDVLDIDLSAET